MPSRPWMMRAEKEIIIIWGVSQIQRFLRLILNGAFQESGVGLPGRDDGCVSEESARDLQPPNSYAVSVSIMLIVLSLHFRSMNTDLSLVTS